jgi:predicted nuclease with TOPRIM domain
MFNKLLPCFGKKVIITAEFYITKYCGVNKNTIMENYKTVDDLLKSMNLTTEELEVHKELIEECRENEQRINECCASTRQNIERISNVFKGIYQNMNVLEVTLEDLLDEAEGLSLKMIPSHKFFYE